MSAVNLAIPFTNALFSIAVLFAVGSSTLMRHKRHRPFPALQNACGHVLKK